MKKLQFIIIRLLVFSALFVIGALGNTVSFDTSFNGTGYVLHQAVPSPGHSIGKSMTIQTDGKIVIAGRTNVGQSPNQLAVMRLNPDGSLDTSFGTGGTVLTSIVSLGEVSKVLIQPDGKILVGATAGTSETQVDFLLVRYNADGSLDTSFNSTGFKTQTVNGTSSDFLNDIALQTDDKIVAVGRTIPFPFTSTLEYDFAAMRFNANGSLDNGFNGSGIAVISSPNVEESAYAVVVQPDGKIVIGGLRSTLANTANFVLVRRNADGTPDTSFGNSGTSINTGSFFQYIQTLALQSDGKILAGGRGYVARYTTAGVLDTSFATNGVASVGEVTKIKVLSDDKFLTAPDLGMNPLRFMKDGAQDTNFAPNNYLPGQLCFQGGIEVRPDGKILLGGSCSANNDSIYRFAAFRLQETRTRRYLDFDGDSLTNLSLFRPSTGHWLYSNFFGTQITSAQFGTSTDRPIPADFTGDGRTDVAVFRPSTGEWFVLRSENGTFYSFPFGTAGDIPTPADFDGDQLADAAVFRPSTNEWYIRKSTGGLVIATFGATGDKPVPSDYDGDFKTDIAIYRPSAGEWWINKSSDGSTYAFQFGTSTDKVVPGDYTGDNKTDAAFWRPSTGEWFILRSEDSSYYSIPFGLSGDLPTPGNYAGDGRFDLVVFRPSTNTWHVQPTGGAYFYMVFGAAGDQPLPNGFVP